MLASIVGAIVFVDAAILITWGGMSPQGSATRYDDTPVSPLPPLPAELAAFGGIGGIAGPVAPSTVARPLSPDSSGPQSAPPTTLLPAIQSGLSRTPTGIAITLAPGPGTTTVATTPPTGLA